VLRKYCAPHSDPWCPKLTKAARQTHTMMEAAERAFRHISRIRRTPKGGFFLWVNSPTMSIRLKLYQASLAARPSRYHPGPEC